MKRFDGKNVLITGTGGGMGRHAAIAFAREGAVVFGCDLKEEGNLETQARIAGEGGVMHASQPVDLGDPDAAFTWVEGAVAKGGGIDILFNNASACRFAPFEDFAVEDWRWSMRNELDLVFYTTRAAWPHMMKTGGVVINTASVAGMTGSGPGGAAHAATKGAIIALTKQLAAEGGPHHIRVNAISPGVIETPGTAELLDNPLAQQALLERNLIKHIGTPENITPVVLMLASDDSAYMTGANIVIDGGRTAW